MTEELNHIDDYYDVENIITRKFIGNNKVYLIKWVGYPVKDCTWEPIAHLRSINNLIKNFEENFPNSIDKRLLKKYCRAINYGIRRKMKRKKQCIKKRGLKNKNIINNNHIIIDLENSIIINEKNKIRKEKANEKSKNLMEIKNIEIEEEKSDFCESSNDFIHQESSDIKLRKPIIIW